jgi:hypothetical protein
MIYADNLTVKEARDVYFQRSGFDERTYTDPWVKLPVLGRTVYLPNAKLRRKAVPLHDIDHILTEYQTDWLGEWQISAYEMGTGCGTYWAAWILNMQAIVVGAIRAPKACIKAFSRGRRSKGVYSYPSFESLLTENVGDLRRKTTATEQNIIPTVQERVLFYFVVFLSAVFNFAPLVILGIFILTLV